MGKYQLFIATNGQFYFNLYSTNGRMIGTSELYVHLGQLFNTMEKVKKLCVNRDNFEIRRDSNKKPYFVLLSEKKEIILKSESFQSPSKCIVGISSVMTNGISEITDMPKSLADKLVEMQRGDACTQCGSVEIYKYDGQSRAWCASCLNVELKQKHKPISSIKIQRNSSCRCGSGLKYKKCCINKKM